MGVSKLPLLTAAPGYIVGRRRETHEIPTPGGIVVPGVGLRLPIVRVIDVGPSCDDYEEWTRLFNLEPGMEVVISGVDQMVDFGYDHLYLIPFDAIIARVEWP